MWQVQKEEELLIYLDPLLQELQVPTLRGLLTAATQVYNQQLGDIFTLRVEAQTDFRFTHRVLLGRAISVSMATGTNNYGY